MSRLSAWTSKTRERALSRRLSAGPPDRISVSRQSPGIAAVPTRPVAIVIVAALLACAAAAWALTIRQSSSMAMGFGGIAILGAGLFIIPRLVMMVAVLVPSVA